MKRSTYVSLLLLGSAVTLANYQREDGFGLTQQRYVSREDCVKDWGDESKCVSTTGGAGSGGGGGGGGGKGGGGAREEYRGPRYYWDREVGRPVTIAADGSESPAMHARIGANGSNIGETLHVGTISRGGFGSFRGFSMGG